MENEFSLAFLTVKDIDPVDMVQTASETGYDYVGLRLLRWRRRAIFDPDDRAEQEISLRVKRYGSSGRC